MFAQIRWRLVAWTVLVLGAILLVLGIAIHMALSRTLLDEVDRDLHSRGDQAAERFTPPLPSGELQHGGYRGGIFYVVLGPNGRVLDNPQLVDTTSFQNAPFAARGDPAHGESYDTTMVDGEPVRLFARPVRGGMPPGSVLVVGKSLAPEQQALNTLLLILVAGGGVGLLLSLAGAWFLAGRALVPIQQAFWRQQEFVADASHELRTPLTVLQSATDLLDQHRAEPLEANGELLDDVRREIGRLGRLAGDLLTLARSDRGELELAVAPLDLNVLAEDVVRRTSTLALSRGIALSHQPAAEPAMVDGDPDRLQQVLLILLDNALKHTPAGGQITVSVRRQGRDGVVEVADTGVGIAAEHLPRVFERFYRADAARSRAEGGAGLGLAIAKTIVDAHGGELALSSTPGAGTRASFRLHLLAEDKPLTRRHGECME